MCCGCLLWCVVVVCGDVLLLCSLPCVVVRSCAMSRVCVYCCVSSCVVCCCCVVVVLLLCGLSLLCRCGVLLLCRVAVVGCGLSLCVVCVRC